MKLSIYTFALLLMMTGLTITTSAQETAKKPLTEAQKQRLQQRSFYRRSLQVDSAKADQVAQVQDTYKANLKAVMADTSLSVEGRRAKIKALIDGKNQQLKGLLTPAQQEKMIPTTERIPSKPKQ